MPKITYLKEIDGGLWARLQLDHPTEDGTVHVFTDKELKELLAKEWRKAWEEIKATLRGWGDDYA